MYRIGKGLGLLLFIVIVGAIVGGLIGEIIGVVVPEGKIRQIFLNGPSLTLPTGTWNLIVLTLTFGFNLKINICSVLGIFSAVLIFRRL